MLTPLIPPGDLIVNAWINFRKHLRTYGEFVVWFVLLRVIQWGMGALTTNFIADRYQRFAVDALCGIPILFGSIILTVSLVDTIAKHLTDQKIGTHATIAVGRKKLFPTLWISILGGLIIGAGFIALIIPGIFLLIRYRYAQNFVIIDDLRGGAALTASKKLVTGRWWPVFGRILLVGVFYYVAVMFTTYLIDLIAGTVLGDPGIFFGQITASQNLSIAHSLVATVITATIDSLALPLFLGADLILWLDLKRTR